MTEFDAEEASMKRKDTAKQREKRVAVAVAEVLSSEAGRTVLKEILTFCQVEQMNGLDGMGAGRIEGARAVGLMTINLLRKHDIDGWIKLYRELHND